MMRGFRNIMSFVVMGMLAALVFGCGGGGGGETDVPVVPDPDPTPTPMTLSLPANHGLGPSITVAANRSQTIGNVVVACPAGGLSCTVNVAADGTATYEGAKPTVTPVRTFLDLPANHGLAAGDLTVPAGASRESGNVEISCPAGGPACMMSVSIDGVAVYLETGGMPTVASVLAVLVLPANHGLAAGVIPVAPGDSVSRGNVVITCPAGGAACELTVGRDGTAIYLEAGGMPAVMAAQAALGLPMNHGLAAGDLTVSAGASEESGNVEITCPAGGPACAVRVGPDGTAVYLETGGMPTVMSAQAALDLPMNHGLAAGDLTVPAGASRGSGNVEITCPAGGPACTVSVGPDGTAVYLATGGMPAVMSAQAALDLPANHGVAAGDHTVPAGTSLASGNVEITCPAGGPACAVSIASDGTAVYLATGGMPAVMAAQGILILPANHGVAVGVIPIEAGESATRGNVVIACPAGGAACEVTVAADGTAVYLETGGMPTVTSAQAALDLPANHGVAAGDHAVPAGTTQESGNVEISCPSGGPDCTVSVALDGTAVYLATGGMPTVASAQGILTLPANHGLAVGVIPIEPGESATRGNVVITCPAGGAACEVTVARDGTAVYLATGGMPTVTSAQAALDLPANHGVTAGVVTIQPGDSETRGNVVITCPAGGAACEVTVARDGTAVYLTTGGTPTVASSLAALDLPANHGLAAGVVTIEPGDSETIGNVVITCPAGGAACEVTVGADGTAVYLTTGGMPTVAAAPGDGPMTAEEKIDALLSDVSVTNFNLSGGDFVQAVAFTGTASTHGSVTQQGGTATVTGNRYRGQFGYWLHEPFVIGVLEDYGPAAALTPFSVGTPAGTNPTGTGEASWTGLVTGYWTPGGGTASAARGNARLTIEDLFIPTAKMEIPSVVADGTTVNIDLPAAWETLNITNGEFTSGALAADVDGINGRFLTGHTAVVGELRNTQAAAAASATAPEYLEGILVGAFGVVSAQGALDLPANHGLAAGVISIAPGGSETRGNVVITCPAGGPACEVTVAADGTAVYLTTGGMPVVTSAQVDDVPGDSTMTAAEKIDALLGNASISNFGLSGGDFVQAIAFTGTASMHGKVSQQRGTATVSGSRYAGEFGYWLDESFVIGVLEDYGTTPALTPFSVGMPAGTNPTGTGKATWTGLVTGYWTPDGGTASAARGNARLTIEDLFIPTAKMEIPSVVAGGNTVNINLPAEWETLNITNGEFTIGDLAGGADGINGRFLTGHTAVVGELRNSQPPTDATDTAPEYLQGILVGAFGVVMD